MKQLNNRTAGFIKKYRHEITLLLVYFSFHLPGLGKYYVQPTAQLWVQRGIHFYEMFRHGNFAETYTKYHPGVTLTWITGISYKIYYTFQRIYYGFERDLFLDQLEIYKEYAFLTKLFLVLVIWLVLLYCFKILEKLIGKTLAFFAILLLILEPFFIGNARSIHLDALVTVFIFASALNFFSFTYFKTKKLMFFTGIFTGLALLTKISALVLFPFYAFYILTNVLFKKKAKLSFLLPIIIITIIIFILLFPAMWTAPIGTVKKIAYDGFLDTALNEESSRILYLGLKTDSIIYQYFSYFFQIIYRLTPINTILILLGFILLFLEFFGKIKLKAKTDPILFKLTVYSLLFILGYYIMISISDKKIFRYILPLYPFLSIISVYSVRYLIYLFKILNISKFKMPQLLLGLFLGYSIYIYKIFPDFFVYFNPLLGGINTASKVISLNQDGTGYYKVAEYLNSKENVENLYVAMYDSGPMHVFFKGHSVKLKLYDPAMGKILDTDYALLPRQIGREYLPEGGYELEKTFKINNFDYWYLYSKIEEDLR